jgi:ubiquinone/menaquinone biosynthesis C-methylase UbiE
MTFKDHFSGHASAYATARPLYPDALFAWLAETASGRTCAWDAGCGNGQAAVALAAFFDQVHATDPSATQIAAAVPHPRVRFAVEPAESCSLRDQSVDLVTVAQALHWFDLDRFVAEVRRVARPGAVLAAWCYGLMRIDPGIDPVIADFEHRLVGPWWPPERHHIDSGYVTLALPFEPLAAPGFAMKHDWTLAQTLAYLGTWSAVQRHDAATGGDAIAALAPRLAAVWGEPGTSRTIEWPLGFIARRL